jgi:hypothetical protein
MFFQQDIRGILSLESQRKDQKEAEERKHSIGKAAINGHIINKFRIHLVFQACEDNAFPCDFPKIRKKAVSPAGTVLWQTRFVYCIQKKHLADSLEIINHRAAYVNPVLNYSLKALHITQS